MKQRGRHALAGDVATKNASRPLGARKKIVQVSCHRAGREDSAEDLEVGIREIFQLFREVALLNILGHRQLLAQPFLAEALGVQRDIFQDDRGLQGHGGQQVEILGLEADALAEPIELDGAEPLTLRVDKRHAQDGVADRDW